MTTDSLSSIAGEKFHEILYRNLHIWTFEKTKYLKQLTKIQVNKVIDQMKKKSWKAGLIGMSNSGQWAAVHTTEIMYWYAIDTGGHHRFPDLDAP